ncbi:right-handed parallel beta-helix repeat-containing protein [Microbispora cellulosiformans]|uniref:Right-handed parallel beta-helix repeat-containing protein n=1 Tax=Microbispora cellulosiformans TaxID=2614688 RepID=A0A5J5JVF6_9ACTN|nr:right-handed parallel beta-helix repeat-containing protein [Microbispora cellulosiformans]KAA9375237.1 right-handed parallel beta-helix repeat-containing protein [Microbispora cellulosiformans]
MRRSLPALLTAAALTLGVAGPAVAAPVRGGRAAAAEPTPVDLVDPAAPPSDRDHSPTPSPDPTPTETSRPSPTPKRSPSARPTRSSARPPKATRTPGTGTAGTARQTPAGGQSLPTPTREEPKEDEEPRETPAPLEEAVMADDETLKAGLISADAEAQARLVDVEDQRIIQTRAALTALLQAGGIAAAQRKRPQVFVSAYGRTLVLPARNDTTAPYTLRDIAAVEKGRYLRRMKDGSYLLGVQVFVADGARLQLRGPLTLRMGSLPGSFSSIISFGGDIDIKGTAAKPVRITSWDVRTRRPDMTTTDGRAYIRAVGGKFEMAYAEVSDLGFWSGRTGGIALTGTERPASVYRHRTKTQRHQDKAERLSRAGSQRGGSSFGDVETIPIGPGTATHVLADDLVSGSIRHSVITGNAYGLFVSGSNQTQIVDDEIRDSLAHGVFLHRFVNSATVQSTKVIGSGGDGFVLSRATEKVQITDCVAERNGRNGFTLNGQALAQGPSASGESLTVYGDNSVNDSVARDNGRYGVEVLGGSRLSVYTSEITGGDMGIVVREGASEVQISGNRLSGQARQGIALRDGATAGHVAGNTITDTVTGIYLRDSNARVVGNKITTLVRPRAHGITMVGDVGATEITRNTVAGSGTSAISVSRSAHRVNEHDNVEDAWHDTSTFWVKAKRYVKPMNLIWAAVILLVIVSALRSRQVGADRRRRRAAIGDPYARQRVLEERPALALRPAVRTPPARSAHGGDRPRHREPSLPIHHPAPAPAAPATGGITP